MPFVHLEQAVIPILIDMDSLTKKFEISDQNDAFCIVIFLY